MSEPPRPIRSSDSSEGSETESTDAQDADPAESSGSGSSEGSETEASPLPSVREVMGEVGEETRADPTPDRILVVDDRQWQIHVIGSTRTGAPGDPGAPLLLLRFSLEDETGGSGSRENGPREGWAVGSVLAEVPETELLGVLERARPVREEGSETDPAVTDP